MKRYSSSARLHLVVQMLIGATVLWMLAAASFEIYLIYKRHKLMIEDLNWILEKTMAQREEYLSGLLMGANGGGYLIRFTSDTETQVECRIVHEWVNGKYYAGDTYRTKKVRQQLAGK